MTSLLGELKTWAPIILASGVLSGMLGYIIAAVQRSWRNRRRLYVKLTSVMAYWERREEVKGRGDTIEEKWVTRSPEDRDTDLLVVAWLFLFNGSDAADAIESAQLYVDGKVAPAPPTVPNNGLFVGQAIEPNRVVTIQLRFRVPKFVQQNPNYVWSLTSKSSWFLELKSVRNQRWRLTKGNLWDLSASAAIGTIAPFQ